MEWYVLVNGKPDEPDTSDWDALCNTPGPPSFLRELFNEFLPAGTAEATVLTEEKADDEVRIARGYAGSPQAGYRWEETTCLETSMIPVSVKYETYGLPGLELQWSFSLDHAGQLGHCAFRHGALRVGIERQAGHRGEIPSESAARDPLNRFMRVWRKVFGRDPVLQREDAKGRP
ncbi:MAG: hypothetical protein RDV41_00670 [Planctomycetota bacterium]|nr:hypothetical protein [Planctomycetota bacterium]